MSGPLPRHARTRRQTRARRDAMLAREDLAGATSDGFRLDAPRWTPADDLGIVTAWHDEWSDDPDRTTRRNI